MSSDWKPDDPFEQASNPQKYLMGSRARDAFKYWHKSLGKNLPSIDLDFVFVNKAIHPGIVAVLDYKRPDDKVSYAEVLAYNQFVELEIQVFIVEAEFTDGRPFENLTVKRYLNGIIKPYPQEPDVVLEVVLSNATAVGFEQWERNLRSEHERFSFQMKQLRKRIERLNEQYRVFISAVGKAFPKEARELFDQWSAWIKISKDMNF